MEGIVVREAAVEDMATLLRFEQGVIAAERPFDPTLKQGDDTCYYDLTMMITAPHIHLVVAEMGEQVIASGYARIESAKPYLQHAQYAYLGFMFVEPTHRGKGVNKLIIDALKRWVAEQGLNELKLEVYYGNRPAIAAYEKVGFLKYMITMRSNLETT